MSKLNFKLNMYFAEYKDKPLPNREEFRKNFKKRYGKFELLEELIQMIEKHQFKKYGMTLPQDNLIWEKSKEERRRESIEAKRRWNNRLRGK